MPSKKAAKAEAEESIETASAEESVETAGALEHDDVSELAVPIQLSGQELLDFYQSKKDTGLSHNAIAYEAGYWVPTQKGGQRVLMSRFNAALLAAQGLDVGDSVGGGPAGRLGLTTARVSGGGVLLVSSLATSHVGAIPGDLFSVEYPGEFQILLTRTGENKPVKTRKNGRSEEEQPATPLLDQLAQ